MSRLQRARYLSYGYIRMMADHNALNWAVATVPWEWNWTLASLVLDGYPASWPRPLRKKERRR